VILLAGAVVVIQSDDVRRALAEVGPVGLDADLVDEQGLAFFIHAAPHHPVDDRQRLLRAAFASGPQVLGGADIDFFALAGNGVREQLLTNKTFQRKQNSICQLSHPDPIPRR
jgi:hypothetical protein